MVDTLYLIGAALLLCGAILIIIGAAIRKKRPAAGWTCLVLGLACLGGAVALILNHYNTSGVTPDGVGTSGGNVLATAMDGNNTNPNP